jgi:drug/metabolite transporter (DMT)-like permease
MVLEPVWAAFFGFAVWNEALGARTLAGSGLVLVAMLIVVSRPSGSRVASVGAAETAGIGGLAPETQDDDVPLSQSLREG